MDGNLHFDSIKIEDLNTWTGTYSFGINGLNVMFGGFKSSIVQNVPKSRPNTNKKSNSVDLNFDEDEKSDIIDDNIDKAEANLLLKKDVGSQICSQTTTVASRRQFCNNDVKTGQTDACLKNFCGVCCYMYDIG